MCDHRLSPSYPRGAWVGFDHLRRGRLAERTKVGFTCSRRVVVAGATLHQFAQVRDIVRLENGHQPPHTQLLCEGQRDRLAIMVARREHATAEEHQVTDVAGRELDDGAIGTSW